MSYKKSTVFMFCLMFSCIWGAEYPVVLESKKIVTLSAQSQGILSEFKVKAGGNILKNGLVSEIKHDELLLKKKLKKTELQLAEKQKKRSQELFDKKVISDEELEQITSKVEFLKIEIEVLDLKIKNSQIRSPFEGIVSSIKIKGHEWVSPGQPVVEIMDKSLIALLHLPAKLISNLKLNDEIEIELKDLKQKVKAKLNRISAKVDVKSNTIKTYWLISSSSDKLKPGMRGLAFYTQNE